MAKVTDSEAAKPANGVSEEAPTLCQSDIGQSPILTVIRKRLRAANKRLKRIEEIEGARAAGKSLDADQEESLRSKPKVLANIEELERLQPLLRQARDEDKFQVEAACKEQAASEARAAAGESSASKIAELEASKQEAEQQAASARAEAEAARSEVAQLQGVSQTAQGAEAAVHRLVELIYFATVFADDAAHHHEAERHACVSYDTYEFESSQIEGQPLTGDDLKLVAKLGKLLTQRPQGPRGETMCHKDVIDSCAQAAMNFLEKSTETIPDIDTTAERVAEIVDRVLSLDYATVRPEVQNAQQSETQQPEAAPHHHPDAAPIPNGFYDQGLQLGGMPYNASEAPAHNAEYGALPEPHSAHYAPMFQPPATDYPLQLPTQETPEEKPYHAPGPAADQPAQINFMHESMVEMEGGHPEPMGAAATEPMLTNPEPSQPSMPAQTVLQALQQGEAAPAPQAASSHAPTVEAPRSFEGRGGRSGRGSGSYGRGGRESGFEGSGRRGGGRGYGRGGRDGGFEGSGRRGGGPRTSGDLGPRSASGDYRGGRGGGRRGGPRGGRGGPAAQAIPQQA